MKRDVTDIQGVIIHHSGDVKYNSDDGQALANLIVDPRHLEERGIKSVAEYNCVIARNGSLLWPQPLGYYRALNVCDIVGHCGDEHFNTATVGICLDGNFMNQTLTPGQSQTLLSTIVYIFSIAKIATCFNQIGTSNGSPVMSLDGHKAIKQTDCPGLKINLSDIRSKVSQIIKPQQISFTLNKQEALVIHSHFEKVEQVKMIQPPFLSSMGLEPPSLWLTEVTLKRIGLPMPSQFVNQNGNVRVRAVASVYGYELHWNPLTKSAILSTR